MKWAKSVLIICCMALVFSACTPISDQIEDLVDEHLPGSDEEIDTDIDDDTEVSDYQMDGAVHGFGMGSSAFLRVADLDQAYYDMAEMGVRYIREEFRWNTIQSGISEHYFTYNNGYDRIIEGARENNLEIVALLTYKPSVSYDGDQEFIELWGAYVQALVDRYGEEIDVWEIGNEMNVLSFWRKVRPGVEAVELNIYGKMLDKAYEIIKDDDPEDVVILGGLVAEPGPGEAEFIPPLLFVEELDKYTSGRPFDAVGLHVYWGRLMPETLKTQLIIEDYREFSMTDYVALFAQDIQQMLGKSIPIWITETGYSQDWLDELSQVYGLSIDEIQAAALARVYTGLLSIPNVETVFWYTYENDSSGQQYAIKPISKSFYQTLSDALTNTVPLGKYPIVDGEGKPVDNCYEYRFLQPNGDTVSIYWKNMPDVDYVQTTIEDLVESPAMGYAIDVGMDVRGVMVEEELTEVAIFEVPGILVGKMDEETRLVVKGEPAQSLDLRKGQIAYIANGNVYYKNLETGEVQQLTHDANWEKDHLHVYNRVTFSPSGRYLAFEYGHSSDRTIRTILYDVTERRKVLNESHQMLIGWRQEEDTLLLGHNSEFCAPPDEWGESTTNEADISFIVYEFNLETGRSSELKQIPNWYRLPIGMTSNHDFMIFQSCACGNAGCSWVREVYTDQGELISPDLTLSSNFSNSLDFVIPIAYSIHELESAPLEIVNRNTQEVNEIFFQEGKFPTSVRWSPDDEWIIFWLGDVKAWDYRSNLLVMRHDGSTVREITPTPTVNLGWFPDGRLMLLSNSMDNIDLYSLETGERDMLAELEINEHFSDIDWSTLPD